MHFWDPSQWDKMCFEYHRVIFHWKKMGQIFHICLRSGLRWLTPPSPLTASLTVKYPLFLTPSLITCGMKRWCWKSSRTAWQSWWRRCGQVCQYMCFYLDVYVCVAPTFAGIVSVFVKPAREARGPDGKKIFLRLFFLCCFRKKTLELVSLFIFRH